MNRGTTALVFLAIGLILQLATMFLLKYSNCDVIIIAIVAIAGFVLWLTGSFLLASHWGLRIAWGYIGMLGIPGILVLLYLIYASPTKARRRRNTKHYPYDYGEENGDEADSGHKPYDY